MAKPKRTQRLKQKPVDSVGVKELRLAYNRINGAPARRLKWLLNFAEMDLDSISEGTMANLRWELVVFGLNRTPDQMKNEFDIYFDLTSLTRPLYVDRQRLDEIKTEEDAAKFKSDLLSEIAKGAPMKVVGEFHTSMREIFDTLFSGQPWRFKRPVEEEAIALVHIKTKAGARWAHNPPAYSAAELLMTQTIDLLKAEWQRLRICQNPRCNMRFVAAKKGRALFHSPKCSAYVRVTKARGKL